MCCFSIAFLYTFPLLLGDVPDGTSSGTGTRSRENRHIQDTNIIPITDQSLCRVIWRKEQVRNLRRHRDALFIIIDNWVILTVLIVRGSTRRCIGMISVRCSNSRVRVLGRDYHVEKGEGRLTCIC